MTSSPSGLSWPISVLSFSRFTKSATNTYTKMMADVMTPARLPAASRRKCSSHSPTFCATEIIALRSASAVTVMCRNGTRSNKPLTNCRILSPRVLRSVVRTQSATESTMRAICTIASPTKAPTGTTTAASADNNVQAADRPVLKRLVNHLKSGVNK
ncbi:Uncharacterised protein [Mycobacterium tuberculosis]|nr:Uncharacterised protein [Mycobacterium tuberculosis]